MVKIRGNKILLEETLKGIGSKLITQVKSYRETGKWTIKGWFILGDRKIVVVLTNLMI